MAIWTRSAALLSACLVLAACNDAAINLNASKQIINQEAEAARVDLLSELVPISQRDDFDKVDNCKSAVLSVASAKSKVGYTVGSVFDGPNAEVLRCMPLAFKRFYADPTDQVGRRNRLQGSLRKASELQCAFFEQDLNTFQATTNLLTGVITSGLAGAGAIVTNTSAARILAGSAGIVSGARAEFNADLFFQKAVPVLVKQIEITRKNQRSDMDKAMARPIADYPVENAIADAIIYNNTCSLVSALSQMEEAVTLADNPGIDKVNQTILKANLTRQLLTRGVVDSTAIRPDGTGNSLLLGMASAGPGGTSTLGQNPTEVLAAAATAVASAFADADSRVQGSAKTDAAVIAATKKMLSDWRKARMGQLTGSVCQAAAQSRTNDLINARAAATQPSPSVAVQSALATAVAAADGFNQGVIGAKNTDVGVLQGDIAALQGALSRTPEDVDAALKRIQTDFTGTPVAPNGCS